MMKNAKYFTLDEANQLIPKLIPLLEQLRVLRADIDKLEVAADSLELILEPEKEDSRVHQELKLKMQELEQLITLMNEKIQQIESYGCFLKSIEMGLVDFLSQNEENPIYLCWSLGEDEVKHWHEIGQGFANRKLLGE